MMQIEHFLITCLRNFMLQAFLSLPLHLMVLYLLSLQKGPFSVFYADKSVHPSEKTKNKINVIIIFFSETGSGLFMFYPLFKVQDKT
jgi:hypothetical protein